MQKKTLILSLYTLKFIQQVYLLCVKNILIEK